MLISWKTDPEINKLTLWANEQEKKKELSSYFQCHQLDKPLTSSGERRGNSSSCIFPPEGSS